MYKLIPLLILCIFGGFLTYLIEQKPAENISPNSWSLVRTTTKKISSGDVCIKNPDITFFMYHYIRDHDMRDTTTTKDLSISPTLFDRHMQKIESLAKEGEIILMRGENFLLSLGSGCFPGKYIWVFTADDGWIDMKDTLVPIATRHGVPFFLGIITNRLDVSGFITKDDLKIMAKNPLITISSHSVSHIDNSKLNELEEISEMCDSRTILRKITGQEVETYIYPSGRINPHIDETVAKKCGYKIAWSTRFGNEYPIGTGSLYDMNRTRISAETDPHFFDVFLEKKKQRE